PRGKLTRLRPPHPPTREEKPAVLQHRGRSVLKTRPPKPAARSRLIIGDFGPSDSALAAARGWRLRRTAADRHAARCASRDLCSGGAPRRYPPSEVGVVSVTSVWPSAVTWKRASANASKRF